MPPFPSSALAAGSPPLLMEAEAIQPPLGKAPVVLSLKILNSAIDQEAVALAGLHHAKVARDLSSKGRYCGLRTAAAARDRTAPGAPVIRDIELDSRAAIHPPPNPSRCD